MVAGYAPEEVRDVRHTGRHLLERSLVRWVALEKFQSPHYLALAFSRAESVRCAVLAEGYGSLNFD